MLPYLSGEVEESPRKYFFYISDDEPYPLMSSMTDPLPAWNDGAAKQAILDFVAQVTTANSPTFVRRSTAFLQSR